MRTRHTPNTVYIRARMYLYLRIQASSNQYISTLFMGVFDNDNDRKKYLSRHFRLEIVSKISIGQFLFDLAATEGREDDDMMKAVLDFGNRDEISALHRAVRQERLTMVQKLLELGANPNASTNSGETPLHMAAILRHSYQSIIHTLLEHNTDIYAEATAKDVKDDMHLYKHPLHVAVTFGGRGAVEVLISSGWHSYSLEGANAVLAFYYAARTQLKMIEVLLHHSAPIDSQNDKGDTALHLFIRKFPARRFPPRASR
jgi:hypothetical protein